MNTFFNATTMIVITKIKKR